MGGFPGEKNRSLIFGALRSIAASNAGVENGAGAGAGCAAAAALGCGARAAAAALALPVVLAGF